MYDANALKVYIDGSALRNPGRGGLALVFEFPDDLDMQNSNFSEGYTLTTNNRMELLACIRAHEHIARLAKEHSLTRAIIVTDSQYVFDNSTRAQFWKIAGWRNSIGRRVENEDLWNDFLSKKQKVRIPVEIRWEKGKTRSILDEVDKLAKKAAKSGTRDDFGYQKGKVVVTKTAGGKAATLFPAAGQEEIIRIYRASIKGKLSNQEYRISFDLFSQAKKEFVAKHYAYVAVKGSDIHRHQIYKVKFNNNPAYPVMEKMELLNTLP